MSAPKEPSLPLHTQLLMPGMRLAVGVSGGADSVALLRALHEAKSRLGLVLSVAHLHHGLRGTEADEDLEFVRKLADELALPLHEAQVDVAAEAKRQAESIEEAGRRLRYAWFGTLLMEVPLDAVATAHTFDDQAETVCAKFLRGAWTEGLGGIHPVVLLTTGRVIRPLLSTTRTAVENYLNRLGQTWRADSSNRNLDFERNRIRHELLPTLENWNPSLREHLAQMSVLARDDESWWQGELKRISPQFLMEGKPVRGGGRASGAALALDVTRFASLHPALARRLLRYAAGQSGVKLDFRATETLRELALNGRSGQKCELPHGLLAERTPRELRLTIEAVSPKGISEIETISEYAGTIPCEFHAEVFGIHLTISLDATTPPVDGQGLRGKTARLRNWKPGDRVRLRYSGSPRKVKEVLERMRITGTSRAVWPVLEVDGQVVWMKGVELEPLRGVVLTAIDLAEPSAATASN